MIVVKRANRIVRVSENEVNKYLSKGYEIVNQSQPPKQTQEVVQPKVVEKPIEKPIEENNIVVQSEVQSEPRRSRKRK